MTTELAEAPEPLAHAILVDTRLRPTCTPSPVVIAHLSAPSILGDNLLHQLSPIDTAERLRAALATLEAQRQRPDTIVITGCLAAYAEPDAYAKLAAAVQPVARRLQAKLVWVIGETDDSVLARRYLVKDREFDYETDCRGLRILTLAGTPTAYDLLVLRDALSEPAQLGTVLAIADTPENFGGAISGDLADIIESSDVRVVIAGAAHQPMATMFAGVPIYVAGSTACTLGGWDSTDILDVGQSFNVIAVDGASLTCSTVATWR